MLKWSLYAALALAIGYGALTAWIRTRPIPDGALEISREDLPPGDHVRQGGIVAVRTPDAPEAAYERLARIVAASPRTRIVSGGPDGGPLVAVTRTRIMGFPDVTQVWRDGDRLVVKGHLVMGKGDMGVNAARVRGWLAEAGL